MFPAVCLHIRLLFLTVSVSVLGLTVKVRLVDLSSDQLQQPVTVRAHQTMTVLNFKKLALQALSLPPSSTEQLHCVLEKYSHELKPLVDDTRTLHDESFFKSNKVRVIQIFVKPMIPGE